ncbi:MAG: hypothetical protein WBQ73_01825 [Candidatus Babeliales bacterium]
MMTLMKKVFVFMSFVFWGLNGTNDSSLKIVEKFDFNKDRTLVQYAADVKRLFGDIKPPYIIWDKSYCNPPLFSSIYLVLERSEEGGGFSFPEFFWLIETYFLNESECSLKEGIEGIGDFFTSDECSFNNFYWLTNVRRHLSLKRQWKKLKNLYSNEEGKETVKDYFQKAKAISLLWKKVCCLDKRLEKQNSFTGSLDTSSLYLYRKNKKWSDEFCNEHWLFYWMLKHNVKLNDMLNRGVWETINATSENGDDACMLVKKAKKGKLTFIDVSDIISKVLVKDKPFRSQLSHDVLEKDSNIIRWYDKTKVALQEVQSLSLKNDDKDKLVKLLYGLNRLLFCYTNYDLCKRNWLKMRDKGLLVRK